MGEEKTTKVSKEFTMRYDILSDVLVSPIRIEILNKLSDHPNGLSYEDVVALIPKDLQQANVRRHFDRLIQEKVIEDKGDGRYALSKLGEETYSTLVKVASKAKSEGIFSGSY